MIGDIYLEGRDTCLGTMDTWSKDIDLDDTSSINRILSASPSLDLYLNGFLNELPTDDYLTFPPESETLDYYPDIDQNMEYSNVNKGQSFNENINLIDNFDNLEIHRRNLNHHHGRLFNNLNKKRVSSNSYSSPHYKNEFNTPSPTLSENYKTCTSNLSLNVKYFSPIKNHTPDSSNAYSLSHLISNNVDQNIKGFTHSNSLNIKPEPFSIDNFASHTLPTYTYVSDNLYNPNPYSDSLSEENIRNTPSNEFLNKNKNYKLESSLDTIFDLDLDEDISFSSFKPQEEHEILSDILASSQSFSPNIYDESEVNNVRHQLNQNFNLSQSLMPNYNGSLKPYNDTQMGYQFLSKSLSSPSPFSTNESSNAHSSYIHLNPLLNSPSHSSISSNDISCSPYSNQKDKKKYQNKIAAAKYRLKKKEETKNILVEENILRESNIMLKNKLTCLVQEIQMLKNLMS